MKPQEGNHFSPRRSGDYLEKRTFVSPDPAAICDNGSQNTCKQKREDNDARIPF